MNPFSFLAKAMSDGDNPSTMRAAMLYGVVIIIGVWAAVSAKNGTVQDFPQSVIEVLGLLVAGKVWQAHIETKAPPSP